MKHVLIRRAVGLCLTLGLVATAFGQGAYWESTTSGGVLGDKTRTEKMYYIPKKFKSESEDGNAMILRLDKQVLYSVNGKEKTYWEMTFEEMEAMMKKSGAKMDDAMAKMQKKLESMPEAQRKMVEKMMKGRIPSKESDDSNIEVTNTGEKKSISGYSCTKYVMKQDGKELMTIWATKDAKPFEEMRKDFEEFQKRMMAMNPMMMKGIVAKMSTIDGFPVETELGKGMKHVVTKIEKRSTPASAFEIPAGYTKVKPPAMETGDEEKEEVQKEN